MPSIIPGFEYDIFISYRQKDNKGDHWVTGFVSALKTELEATFKEDISIYFDENPHDGLLETHNVDKSLEGKLKCLIFIPIISQTYCDTKSFAWQHEFCAFKKMVMESPPLSEPVPLGGREEPGGEAFGRDIKLNNGNVASRILPIKIHELDAEDKATIENELGGVLRAIEFIYKEPGVNRPLKSTDNKNDNQNKTDYRNQVNKVANATKELIVAMQHRNLSPRESTIPIHKQAVSTTARKKFALVSALLVLLSLAAYGFYYFGGFGTMFFKEPNKSIAVLPFKNLSNDPDQEYFTQGITEDILNHLTKIADLRVKASYASFNYKESTKSISEIGEELEVSSILTGSIQRAGKNVRIIARLVDVETNEQIWSENYDRQIDEVLSVQSNIAIEIARVLQATLSSIETKSIRQTATKNMDAYDNYLRARLIIQGTRFEAFALNEFNSVLALLNKAIALDPSLADAYGLKGVAWFFGKNFGFSNRVWLDSSLYFAEKTIQFDPQNPRGYLLRHSLRTYKTDFVDYQDLSDLEKAYTYAPNNTDILGSIGASYLEAGKAEGADLIVKNGALKFTTLDVSYYTFWARMYWGIGDFNTAEKLYQEALRLEPQSALVFQQLSWMKSNQHDYKGAIQYGLKERKRLLDKGADLVELAGMTFISEAYTMTGKFDSAEYYIGMFTKIESTFSDTTQYLPYRHRLGYIRWQRGDKKEAMMLFKEELKLDSARLLGKTGIGSGGDVRNVYYDLAITHAFMGNKESAYKCFDELFKRGIPDWMFWYFENDLMLKEFRKEPRFIEFFKKVEKQKQFRIDALKGAINRYEAGKELKDRAK